MQLNVPPEGNSESGSSGAWVVGAAVGSGASVTGARVVGGWVVGAAVGSGASVGHTGGDGTVSIRYRNVL